MVEEKKRENVSQEELKEMIDEGDLSVEDLQKPPHHQSHPDVDKKVEESKEDGPRQEQKSSGREQTETYPNSVNVSNLPSQGLMYDFEVIRFRGFKVSEMRKLDLVNSGASLQAFHQNFFEVIQRATDKDMMELSYGDESAVFIQIRANTWPDGHLLGLPSFTCNDPECGEENVNQDFDLNNLEYTELDGSYEEPKNYNVDGRKIQLRMLREKDMIDLEKFMSRYQNGEVLDGLDDSPRSVYNDVKKSLFIRSISDKKLTPDWHKLPTKHRMKEVEARFRLIENDELTINQYNLLSKFEEKYAHDIDLNVTVECIHCGNDQETVLPLNREFFYPEDNRDIEDYEE